MAAVISSILLRKYNPIRVSVVSVNKNLTRKIISSSCIFKKKDNKTEITKSENVSPASSEKDEGIWKQNSDDELWQKGRLNESIVEESCETGESKPPEPFVEEPGKRIVRVLKYDYVRMKEQWMTRLGFEFKSELEKYYYGPTEADIVIIGGGAIGSSCAYWLKEKLWDGLSVVVIERDFTYKMASSSLSVGGLRQQFSLPESIHMSLFGAEFMRSIDTTLKVEGLPVPNISFQPYGYLLLASEEGAETLMENSKLQNSLGAKNVLLNTKRLKQKFPWLSTSGIALGCLGLEKEGWFDPWMLMLAFKTKAISLGAQYLRGEVVGFQFDNPLTASYAENFRDLKAVIVKRPDGICTAIKFHKCILAAGYDSGIIGRLVGFGEGSGLLNIPLPVERRKRYVYCFHCPEGPGLNTPLTVDPSGMYFRREGLNNKYIAGLSPPEEEEPRTDNLDVDYEYFDEKVWPLLAKRIPCFEKLKVQGAWAGFYEHNPIDKNGIIGPHPIYSNLLFACGFSGHGIQHAPAVGRAISELVINGEYMTIDLNRLHFKRFGQEDFLLEKNIV